MLHMYMDATEPVIDSMHIPTSYKTNRCKLPAAGTLFSFLQLHDKQNSLWL